MSLLEQPPLDLAGAAERLMTLRRRVREMGAAAALLGAGAVAAFVAGRSQVGFSAAIAAAAGLAFGWLATTERVQVLTRLVAQGDGERVREASRFAVELVSPRRRTRLARGLEQAAQAGRPGVHEFTWVRPERALDVAAELLRLAAAFRDPAVAVAPPSAALCRRMLCEPAVSPLYNDRLPEAELERLLHAIGRGLG